MKQVKEKTDVGEGMVDFVFEVENDFQSCYFVKDGDVIASLQMKEMIKFLEDSLEVAKEYSQFHGKVTE